ncbi:MAG TPA: hypothetical protein VMU85_18665 [Stellaceae bacterium]|nr:hypothetical protein [Stellaceae bacterium]
MGKIEVWGTLGAAYGFAFGNLGRFLRLSGAWLAGSIGFNVLFVLHLPLAVRLLGALGMALFLLGGLIAFPLAWHRLILLGEERGIFAALRFGRRQCRFLTYMILTSLIVGLSAYLALIVAGSIAAAVRPRLGTAAIIIPAVAILAMWCLASRVTLALPAIAVDEAGAVLRHAWRRGRGNGTRLVLGWVLCSLPFIVASDVLHALQVRLGERTVLGGAVVGALPFVVEFLEAAVTVGFLSRAYQQLAAAAPDEAPSAD